MDGKRQTTQSNHLPGLGSYPLRTRNIRNGGTLTSMDLQWSYGVCHHPRSTLSTVHLAVSSGHLALCVSISVGMDNYVPQRPKKSQNLGPHYQRHPIMRYTFHESGLGPILFFFIFLLFMGVQTFKLLVKLRDDRPGIWTSGASENFKRSLPQIANSISDAALTLRTVMEALTKHYHHRLEFKWVTGFIRLIPDLFARG